MSGDPHDDGTGSGPEWLRLFQQRFSAVLRTPLDRSSGTLRATDAAYPGEAANEALPRGGLSGRQRLAVYNRQYWFRLFGALQAAYPLTSALTGAWAFNEYAGRFLLQHPPRTPDLADVGYGFAAWLADPRAPAVTQAACVDEAFHRTFRAVVPPPFSFAMLASLSPARIATGRLRPSEAVAIVEEDWPLVALRTGLRSAADAPLPLPAPHAAGRRHLLIRNDGAATKIQPIPAPQAHLYRLLGDRALGPALGAFEASYPRADRARLAADGQRWLAEGVQLELWSGIDLP